MDAAFPKVILEVAPKGVLEPPPNRVDVFVPFVVPEGVLEPAPNRVDVFVAPVVPKEAHVPPLNRLNAPVMFVVGEGVVLAELDVSDGQSRAIWPDWPQL